MGDDLGILVLVGLVLVLAGMAIGWLLHSSRSERRKFDADIEHYEQQLAERHIPRHAYTAPTDFSSFADG